MRLRRGSAEPVRQPRPENDQAFAFRRSRTLTGSAATQVRAATEDRGQLQSSRLHEHTLRKRRRRLSLYLAGTVCGVGLLWYAVSSYAGHVRVTASRPLTRALDTSRYEGLFARYMNEHPLERFRFALDDQAFDRFMVRGAPEIRQARLDDGPGLTDADLTLTVREPVVAWSIKGRQYYVDETGSAYTINYFQTPTVVVEDKSGVSADAGVVASTKLLRFIGRVTVLVNRSGTITVEKVELPEGSTRQVDFRVAGHDFPIRTNVDRDPAGQAADIVNAITHITRAGIVPEYVDVRVSSKAYYRDRR